MSSPELSLTLHALADPTRRAILAQLQAGTATVSEVAAPHAMSGPAISKHLGVLERAGLISRSRRGTERPCTLTAEPLREVAEWAADFRAFWDESFDRLDHVLQEGQEPTSHDH